MKISLRFTIALVVAATVPLLISGGWSLYTLHRVNALVTGQSEAALVELGEEAIRQKAEATARHIELYLDTHPEVDLNDMAQLEANTALADIALQPVGQTGYTAVFDEGGITHFHINPEIVGTDMSTLADELPEFWAIFAASLGGSPSTGYYDWIEADGQIRRKYMSIVPIGGTPLRLAATTYIDEFSYPVVELRSQLAEIRTASITQLILTLAGVTLLAVAGAFALGWQLSQPLGQIAEAAARVTVGDMSPVGLSTRQDEIGVLARTFNAMTAQIHDLLNGLEERNRDLERKAAQLEAASQVARDASAARELDDLLSRAVNLIRDRFGFYHAGIFLVDDQNEYAVLKAATGAAGRQMLKRGHKLKVGEVGVVGYVTDRNQPHIALDVGADAVHFKNPLLPHTRSEMALPLRLGERVIGALDVQSNKEAAFDEEDVTVLQIMADQLAVAIENARLLHEMHQNVREMEAAYGRFTKEAWHAYAQSAMGLHGYRYRRLGVEPAADLHAEAHEALQKGHPILTTATPGVENDYSEEHRGQEAYKAENPQSEAISALAVPIKLREQVIGVLNLHFESETISPETVLLVEEAAGRLALVLENARLVQEAQRQVSREHQINLISARARSSMNLEAILQNTVRELGNALGSSRTFIQLGIQENSKEWR
jgi:GAF domain-containing protein/HAMP domain-containing protein